MGSGEDSIAVNGAGKDKEPKLEVPNRVIEEGVRVVRGAIEPFVQVTEEG